VKIGYFNELYQLCKKNDQSFDFIKKLMLINGWINPMHTDVPGPDGKFGFGGACFPKDTSALRGYMRRQGTDCGILDAAVEQNKNYRTDL
jgi:UDPglucose 6-dehydrogenase